MRKSKITPDMSIYEASAFWDEHDFSEFDDVQETKEVKFDELVKSQKSPTIVIPVKTGIQKF